MKKGVVEVGCRPITPIWTGDANQKGAQIRETGLIGSLRWWYEAMLRGAGFYACDPTSNGSCLYEESANLAGICLACQFFGCTGYSRRFRLEIDGENTSGQTLEVRLKNPGIAKHRGWRIPKELTKPFRLKIVPLFAEGFDIAGIGLTLRLIERFGALGAKTSQGQGVVQFDSLPAADFAEWKDAFTQRPHKPSNQRPNSPSLDNILGVTVELAPQIKDWWKSIPLEMKGFGFSDKTTWIPSAPAVRAMLRTDLRNLDSTNENERHRLMGTIGRWGDPRPEVKDGKKKDRTKASDVFVSHLYREQDRWRMRIFAFVAKKGNGADRRLRELLADGGLNELKGKLAAALGLTKESIAAVEPYPSKLENFFL
jgi:CRISPR type III-B/RAMP module RAMP protein Cmr1